MSRGTIIRRRLGAWCVEKRQSAWFKLVFMQANGFITSLGPAVEELYT